MKTYLCLDSRCLREYQALKPILKEMVSWVQDEWIRELMYVTSIRRTEAENIAAKAKTRIHVVPGRAIDIRIYNLGSQYRSLGLNLAKKVNRRWCYDPARSRLNVAFARSHGTGPHLHLQVHPRTTRTPFRITELAA